MAFPCGQCDRSFKTEQALNQHIDDSPAHEATFSCDECNRCFSSDEALAQHLRDAPIHATRFDCDDCNRCFNNEDALQQHLRNSPAHATTFGPDGDDSSFDSGEGLQHQFRSGPTYSIRGHSLFPSLHDEVAALLEENDLFFSFHDADTFDGCLKDYDTNIMGTFVCNNRGCSTRKWSSKRIAITIRLYRRSQYNAVVWHQKCQGCNRFGQPILDDTYAERIAYRLKRWHGVAVEVPYYSGVSKGPHLSDLCEGCKNGRCKQGM